jgi:hypothetical protein
MEKRELTVEDLLDPETLLSYVADYFLGEPLNLKPLLRLRDYCMPLVLYDKWWDETAIVREKHDSLMKEISHLLIHYRFCFEEPKYPGRVCKRLRRRLEAHVRGARKLLARVEELIKEGEDFDVVRKGNYEHLMWRLAWMRDNLTRAIEGASKLLAKEAVSQDAQG